MTNASKLEVIQKLIQALGEIPFKDIEKLEAFKSEADAVLKNFEGDTEEYRYRLGAARFAPWSADVKETEYERNWESGVAAILSILREVAANSTIVSKSSAAHPTDSSDKEENLDAPLNVSSPEPIQSAPLVEEQNIEHDQIESSVEKSQDSSSLEESATIPNPAESTDKTVTPVEKSESSQAELSEQSPPQSAGLFSKLKSIFQKKEPATVQKFESPKLPQANPPVDSNNKASEELNTPSPESLDPKPPESETVNETSKEASKTDLMMEEAPETKLPLRKQILVIHGSDEDMKDKVVEFLSQNKLEAVLAHDKTNYLKPLNQLLSEYNGISYVVVLLSFDAFSYLKDQKVKDAKLVALQNVVFDLGYMLGKFGRHKVFVLYQEKKNFELPSQFFEALFIVYDKKDKYHTWQKELLKTLTGLFSSQE